MSIDSSQSSTEKANKTNNTESSEKGVSEDLILENLGYESELKRNFSTFETFGVAFGITGLVPSIASTLTYSITSGAVGLTWGWLVPGIFITFVGLAMSELASMMPTAGGLYYWAFHLSPAKHRYWLCFLVAYSNILGNLAAASSVNYAAAQLLFSLATVASNGTWAPTQAQNFAVVVLITIIQGLLCSVNSKWIAIIQNPLTALNILLLVGVIIALLVCTPNSDIKGIGFVLGDLQNYKGGWPTGLNFLIAWLSAIWTICSFDTATHISEEASNASTAVPWAITWTCISATLLGFILSCVIAACMPNDIQALLDSVYDLPLIQIFQDRIGNKATLFFIVCMLIIQFDMGLSINFGISRTLWAFARDKGVPYSSIMAKVHKKTALPLNAVWTTTLLCILFSALTLINTVLADMLFAISTAGIYPAYMIPSICKLIWGKHTFFRGPWHLGKYSTFVHSVAVAFSVFVIVIFCFPSLPGPKAPDMNYACLMIAIVLGGCLLYFFSPKYGAQYWFEGPGCHMTTDEIQAIEVEHQGQKMTISEAKKQSN